MFTVFVAYAAGLFMGWTIYPQPEWAKFVANWVRTKWCSFFK